MIRAIFASLFLSCNCNAAISPEVQIKNARAKLLQSVWSHMNDTDASENALEEYKNNLFHGENDAKVILGILKNNIYIYENTLTLYKNFLPDKTLIFLAEDLLVTGGLDTNSLPKSPAEGPDCGYVALGFTRKYAHDVIIDSINNGDERLKKEAIICAEGLIGVKNNTLSRKDLIERLKEFKGAIDTGDLLPVLRTKKRNGFHASNLVSNKIKVVNANPRSYQKTLYDLNTGSHFVTLIPITKEYNDAMGVKNQSAGGVKTLILRVEKKTAA